VEASKGIYYINSFLVSVPFWFRRCWNNGLLLRWDNKTRSKIIGEIRGYCNPAQGMAGRMAGTSTSLISAWSSTICD
jgi:hypothetical protein